MHTTNSGVDAGGQPSTVKDLRNRLLENGYTPLPGMSREVFSRIAAAAETDACIMWPFYRNKKGHGHTRHEGVRRSANWVACYLRHGPPPFPGAHAAHLCHNNGCVNGKHLEWQTPLENIRASVAVGKHIRGERVHTAKRTAAEVLAMRAMHAAGATQRAVAEHYGVPLGSIGGILNGQRWRHI